MQDRGGIRVWRWESAVATLSSIPVTVFGYTCHQNVSPCLVLIIRCAVTDAALQMFSILNEISNNSHARTTYVVFASIGTAVSIYILVAVTGYLSFGNAIGGNIVAMCEGYPLSSFCGAKAYKPFRCSLTKLYHRKSCYCRPRNVLIPPPSPPLQSLGRRSLEMATRKTVRFIQFITI